MGGLRDTGGDGNIQPELACGPATARVCVIVLMSVAPIITKGPEDAKGLGLQCAMLVSKDHATTAVTLSSGLCCPQVPWRIWA